MLKNPPSTAAPQPRTSNTEPTIGTPESNEEFAIRQILLGAVLLSKIAERLDRKQLQIADARRLCISISFVKAALRELEFGTELTAIGVVRS